VIFCPKRDICSRGYTISETILAGWSNNNNNFGAIRNNSTLGTNKNNGDKNNIIKNINSKNGEMMDTYAVALITSNKDGNTKLTTKKLIHSTNCQGNTRYARS